MKEILKSIGYTAILFGGLALVGFVINWLDHAPNSIKMPAFITFLFSVCCFMMHKMRTIGV